MITLLKKIRRQVNSWFQSLFFDTLVRRIAVRGEIEDAEEIYKYMARGNFGIVSAIQARDEIVPVLTEIRNLRPKVVVEIGTANGGTLFTFTRVASPDALIVSLDLPGGAWGGGYSESRIPLYKAFALPGQEMHLIRDDSHQQRSLDALKKILGHRTIDFLFIDGDHSYEGVSQDYQMFSPLVSRGGIIGFHDIVYADGVKNLWNEIKGEKDFKEYISKGNRKFGIGLITR